MLSSLRVSPASAPQYCSTSLSAAASRSEGALARALCCVRGPTEAVARLGSAGAGARLSSRVALHPWTGQQRHFSLQPPWRAGGGWGGAGGSFGAASSPSGDAVLGALIALNVAVYLGWQVLDRQFMARNFMVSSEALQHGRWYTVVTCIFSQKDMGHLLANLVTLYFFGREVGLVLGGPYLLGLYLTGGVVGSLAHVVHFRLKNPRRTIRGYTAYNPYWPPALGASAAVNAIVLLGCLLEPFRVVYLNMILPVPSFALGLLFIAQDLYGAQSQSSRVGHAAHLGGAAVGILAWLQIYLKRRRPGRFRF